MTQRHVLVMAICTAVVLSFFSLGLHHCALSAEEAEVRLACRSICELGTRAEPRDAVPGAMGELATAFQGVACRAMSDEAPQLLRCRDALSATGMSVADYHCVRDAESLAEAHGCDVL